jgi:hypothetical protein
MPTPHITFRLHPDKAKTLREMAKVFGSPTASDFLREMVGAMCSGNVEEVKAFVGRLIQRSGEQLTLQLNASLDVVAKAPEAPRKARKTSRKPRKERKG